MKVKSEGSRENAREGEVTAWTAVNIGGNGIDGTLRKKQEDMYDRSRHTRPK